MSSVATPPAFLERVSSALRSTPYVAGNRVQVEAESGHVCLRGSVESFFQKQMAQEVIRRVDGVQRIDNLLEVNWA